MAQMSLENLLRAVLEGGVDGAKAELRASSKVLWMGKPPLEWRNKL